MEEHNIINTGQVDPIQLYSNLHLNFLISRKSLCYNTTYSKLSSGFTNTSVITWKVVKDVECIWKNEKIIYME